MHAIIYLLFGTDVLHFKVSAELGICGAEVSLLMYKQTTEMYNFCSLTLVHQDFQSENNF